MPTLREFVLTACAVELGLEVPGHRQAGDPLEPDARAVLADGPLQRGGGRRHSKTTTGRISTEP